MDNLGFDVGTGTAVPEYKDFTFLADLPGTKQGRFKIFGLWGTSMIRDVAFFYAMEKNTFMCTFGGMHYPLDYTLDHLDEILDPDQYFRINRQTIVHFGAITRMSLMPKSRIKLHTTPETPNELMVSTARTPQFRKWLDK